MRERYEAIERAEVAENRVRFLEEVLGGAEMTVDELRSDRDRWRTIAESDLLEALIVCAEQLAHCLGNNNKAVEQARAAIMRMKYPMG